MEHFNPNPFLTNIYKPKPYHFLEAVNQHWEDFMVIYPNQIQNHKTGWSQIQKDIVPQDLPSFYLLEQFGW
jgi:hypothetical protein